MRQVLYSRTLGYPVQKQTGKETHTEVSQVIFASLREATVRLWVRSRSLGLPVSLFLYSHWVTFRDRGKAFSIHRPFGQLALRKSNVFTSSPVDKAIKSEKCRR